MFRKVMIMEIKYSKQAIKFLAKQTAKTQQRIISTINRLPYGDIKELQGTKGKFRLRVGSYRVIFDRNGNIVFIEKIDNRGQIYKGE